MNTAIVITRYARALVKYVRETGNGEQVCAQAQALVQAMDAVPDLQRMMEARDVLSDADKLRLLRSALGGNVSPELDRFLQLVIGNGRSHFLHDILRDFVVMYQQSIGIRHARLTASREPSPELIGRIKDLVKQKTGRDVTVDVEVDPSLIGGFVLDIDDYLLDASVKRQLDLIREQFIEKNRRII